MRLGQYLNRIFNILYSRQEIVVEQLALNAIIPDREEMIVGRLRFWDGSLLYFSETLVEREVLLLKAEYAYHYQNSAGDLVFRYDNSPHHPYIATHPHHKHLPTGIVAAQPPDFSDVLQEIDSLLYD